MSMRIVDADVGKELRVVWRWSGDVIGLLFSGRKKIANASL
jgi:hypothetical protein